MQILLAAATITEIKPTVEWLKSNTSADIQVLITGVGSMTTAFTLTRAFYKNRPDLVIQAGIGGSFSNKYAPGSIVFIGEEVTGDMGATEQGRLRDIFDMGFTNRNENPFTNGMLVNPYKEKYKKFGLDFVRGATVNNVSSTPAQVSILSDKYNPIVESMEGAALHYVCLMENIPFLQLRAVSNFAGERNKTNWKIKEAILKLNEQLKVIIPLIINELNDKP